MKLKIKKLHPDAIIPGYQKVGDSGFDLHALEYTVIEPGKTALLKTGISIELPLGYELQVRPRSGLTLKTPIRVQFGTVDAGYRGDIGMIVTNTKPHSYSGLRLVINKNEYNENSIIIQKGDKIAQGVVCPVIRVEFEEATFLSDSERGIDGFGSTGV